ncbi:MAG: glycosyltransferase [Gemmatimonadota bacterium]
MKALVVTNLYPTAARPTFGIFVARQVDALRRIGIEVEVEVIAADRGRADYLRGRKRVAQRIAHWRPALLHAHFGYTPAACVGQGVPFIVTLHGDDINGASDGRGGITLKSRIGVLATLALCRRARMVICQNERMAARVSKWSKAPTTVLPMGVDEREFSPGPREIARRRVGVPDEGLVVCFVNSGRQATKRIDLAQATIRVLASRGVDATFLVADGVPAGEMVAYYRAADCLLMTSDSEGSPMCVKEALACGTPVVGVAVGDLPELLAHSAMGIVAPRDAERLADAVIQVTGRPRSPVSLLPAELGALQSAQRIAAIYADVAE